MNSEQQYSVVKRKQLSLVGWSQLVSGLVVAVLTWSSSSVNNSQNGGLVVVILNW